MTSPLSNRIRIASSLCALLAIIACAQTGARGQDRLFVPSPPAPPPLKYITTSERTQLSTVRDAKTRTRTSIEMAETRLLRAEQFTADQSYLAATTELGIYQALIEDAIRFLGQQKADSNKTRDLYKRLEIQLRVHATRIESMRRVTPSEYADHVKAIGDFTDSARTDVFNAFFSDTVLQQEIQEREKTSANENSAGTSTKPPKKP